MILTSLAIAAGTVAASLKVYREKKRKKELPWTVAAERMGIYPLVKRENRFVATAKTALTQLKAQQKRPLCVPIDTSQEELASLSSGSEQAEISMKEEELNWLLTVSAGSFALTSASLWVPALNVLSVPTLIYLMLPILKRAKILIFEEKRLGLALVDLIWATGSLVTGHYVIVSLFLGFLYFVEKLLMKTEDHSMSNLVNIFAEHPRFLWIVVDGVEVEVPFEKVQGGDTVVIQAGQTIAVDGMIVEGYATIDQRTLTGESQPVEKGIGDQVLASTVVLGTTIK